jgi:hypothetical protein
MTIAAWDTVFPLSPVERTVSKKWIHFLHKVRWYTGGIAENGKSLRDDQMEAVMGNVISLESTVWKNFQAKGERYMQMGSWLFESAMVRDSVDIWPSPLRFELDSQLCSLEEWVRFPEDFERGANCAGELTRAPFLNFIGNLGFAFPCPGFSRTISQ